MKYLLAGIMLCTTLAAQSQNIFKALIKNNEDGTLLVGATIHWKEQNQSYLSDSAGLVSILNIPDGIQSFQISFIGFAEKTVSYVFPLTAAETIEISLDHDEEDHEEEVVVTATRL